MSKLIRQEPAPRLPLPPASQDSNDKGIEERVEAEVQRRLRERTDADVKSLQARLDQLESHVSAVAAAPLVPIAAAPARSVHPAAYFVLGALSGVLGVVGSEKFLSNPAPTVHAPAVVVASAELAPAPPPPLMEFTPVPAPDIVEAELGGPHLTILPKVPVEAAKVDAPPVEAATEPPAPLEIIPDNGQISL